MQRFLQYHRFLLISLVLVFMGAPVSLGGTIYVDDDAPGDPGQGDPTVSDPLEDGTVAHPFDAIQEGIDQAVDGDEVLVLDGTYTGVGNKNLDFGGRAITVRSESGPRTTIIDIEGFGWAFYFHSNETSTSVVHGFTITNGITSSFSSGVVRCYNSGPTIDNCFITGNATLGSGGGIHCDVFSDPVITNCVITENTADEDGGGVFCDESNAWILNCIISKNTAVSGGGICCIDSTLTVTGCTITNNVATGTAFEEGSGGVYCDDSDLTVTNCVLWSNWAHYTGPDIYAPLATFTTVTVSYSDVQGWIVHPSNTLNWGDGNISVDPVLSRTGPHLQADSPCINTGDPSGSYVDQHDLDGEVRVIDGRVDMGADEFLDTDADVLPDWWEQSHFGSPTVGNPAGDEDGDGRSNLQEHVLSTDPFLAWVTHYVSPADTIQAAIDAAHPYEQDVVILSEGTYTGVGNRDISFGGKVLTVRSTDPVDPAVVAATVIDCQGNPDLHRGFLFDSYEEPGAVLTGLTIRGGYADMGGAIYSEFSRPTISKCTITANVANLGGGISSQYFAHPTVTDCRIIANKVEGSGNSWGGGVYMVNGPSTITGCTIAGNIADFGGGMSGSGTLADCTITGNVARFLGGGVHSTVGLTNCSVVGNKAGTRGGGVYGYFPRYIGSTIAGNVSDVSGGGVYVTHSSALGDFEIRNCTVSGNRASSFGGIFVLIHNTVVSNTILWGDSPDEIIVFSGSVNYCNVQGGYAGDGNIEENPHFVSDPSWTGDWTADAEYDPQTFQVTFIDANAAWVANEMVGRFVNPNTSQWLQFVIIANTGTTLTVWADRDSIDASASWVALGMSYQIHDYHLTAPSPCIEAGDPGFVPEPDEIDMDGEPRIMGCWVDMGADEFTAGDPGSGDFNGDGIVGLDDVPLFVQAVLDSRPSADCFGDLNGDGAADGGDVQSFVDLLTP